MNTRRLLRWSPGWTPATCSASRDGSLASAMPRTTGAPRSSGTRPGRSVPEPPYTSNRVGVIGSVASVRHQVIQSQRHLAGDCQGRSWSSLVSMRASGRSRGCDLVKLREHMPEGISEYLGTDHLNTSVEKQLAHSGEEDRRIDTSGTAKLAKAVGQRVAHLVDGGTGFGIGGHASTLAGSMCDRHAAAVSLEAAPIRNRWQYSGRVPPQPVSRPVRRPAGSTCSEAAS